MTTKVLSEAEASLCQNWVKFYAAPLGYVDCNENAAQIHSFIDYHSQGVYSYDNLTLAMESQRSNLIGIGVSTTPAMQQEIAKREANKKAAEENKRQADHNNAVAANFVKMYAPKGLIVGDDFYGSTQDKIIAFIKNKYPGQLVSNEILTDAIRTMWQSLDWFSREPADMEFRNMVKAPRVLSQRAKEEAGLLPQRDLRSHAMDGKFNNPNDAIRDLLKKVSGQNESPEESAANKISVNTRFSKLDHGATASIRKIFVRDRKGGIDWSQTLKARLDAASSYERDRNKIGKYEK
jgi:hypothetical protein